MVVAALLRVAVLLRLYCFAWLCGCAVVVVVWLLWAVGGCVAVASLRAVSLTSTRSFLHKQRLKLLSYRVQLSQLRGLYRVNLCSGSAALIHKKFYFVAAWRLAVVH